MKLIPRRFAGGREDLRKPARKAEQTRLLTPEHLRSVYIQANHRRPLALRCPYREAAHNLNANWSLPRIDARPPRIVQQRESNCSYGQISRPEFLRRPVLLLLRSMVVRSVAFHTEIKYLQEFGCFVVSCIALPNREIVPSM